MKVAPYICSASPSIAGNARKTLDSLAPARARTTNTVGSLRGMVDLGVRNNDAMTGVTLVLRPTPTLHADEQTVVDRMQAAGFTVTQRFPKALVVDVRAPAMLVARYFATTLSDFAQGRWGTRYANTRPITIPAEIAPYLSGVLTNNLITHWYKPPIFSRR